MTSSEHVEAEIRSVLNRYSQENYSNTPDFILARYVSKCLDAFNEAVNIREGWYGRPCSEKSVRLDPHLHTPPVGHYDIDREVTELQAMIDAMPDDAPKSPAQEAEKP